jgi:hypothetical protein
MRRRINGSESGEASAARSSSRLILPGLGTRGLRVRGRAVSLCALPRGSGSGNPLSACSPKFVMPAV